MDWIHLAKDRDQWQALVNTAVHIFVLTHMIDLEIVSMIF
jgi:hypothetical protein